MEDTRSENAKLLQDAFDVAVEPPAKPGGYYVLKTGARDLQRVMSALRPFSDAVESPFQLARAELKNGRVHMSLSDPTADAVVLFGPQACSKWRAAQPSPPPLNTL
jgi:hypothetical protein